MRTHHLRIPAPFMGVVIACALILATESAHAVQLVISWTDNSNGLARTRVERRLATGTTFAQVADVAQGVSSYADSAISPGTKYCYRARSYTSTIASAYSNESCATSSTDGSLLMITVRKAGTGAGTITSSPTGITCGSDCGNSYPATGVVALAAIPAPGSKFAGWSGGGCSGTSLCVVAGNATLTITATFTRL